MTGLVSLILLAAAQAPITSVTIYSDQARVVRTASVAPADSQVVEFPLLHGTVDVATIRVEATGAQVQRVDLESVDAEMFFGDAARKAWEEVEKLKDRIAVATAAREARDQQIDELKKLTPAAQKDELGRPAPRLDASGWAMATQFVAARIARLQLERGQLSTELAKLELDRARATKEAERLGSNRIAGGVRVRAVVKSEGNARVMLSYETAAARWSPAYELQYLPDRGQVVLAFSGLVSQESGEDWEGARLTLSTAHPTRFERAPELLAWRIGQADRFIPTPTPVQLRVEPAPALGAEPPAEKQAQASLGGVRSHQGLALAAPQASGKVVGTVVDASTNEPLADIVVSASSPQLQIPLGAVTDRSGNYTFTQLSPGTYSFRFEKEAYKPYGREFRLEANEALRLNVQLLPESLMAQEVVVAGKPPVIEQGAVQRGLPISSNFASAPQARHAETGIGLGPPQAYRGPPPAAQPSPAEVAGLDLAFASAHPETVLSGKGTLRVPLTTETWPVTVARKAFPALSPQTYLVARLKSPAKGVLPGGPVALSVGTDPAGTAELPIMRPGEDLTLPLGVDRALRPIRNVQLVLAEEGVFSKDDASEYRVTLEMANPYRIPVAVTFVDQVPLAHGDNIKVSLLETKPWAREDKETGRLEWDLVLPPSGKTTASFRYRVVRPKGWKLEQRETEVQP